MDLYKDFKSELFKAFGDHGYVWTNHKSASCDWMLSKIPSGSGADVGGTAYLVKKAVAMGRDITYFDYFPPKPEDGITKYVAADMEDFGNHFAPRSLDFITTRHTLEHSLNPFFQLWQYNRTLREKGTLLVIVPTHAQYWVWFYSHFNCLPRENWVMLFYRAGFKVVETTAGTWGPHNPDFIETRFVLRVESRSLRLDNPPREQMFQ